MLPVANSDLAKLSLKCRLHSRSPVQAAARIPIVRLHSGSRASIHRYLAHSVMSIFRAAAVDHKEPAMTKHKFEVGEAVIYTQGRGRSAEAVYEIRSLLPSED